MLAEDGLVPHAEINVTPLVDVAFVLLIIFMVITPLLRHGYDVTIPEVRAGQLRRGDRGDGPGSQRRRSADRSCPHNFGTRLAR